MSKPALPAFNRITNPLFEIYGRRWSPVGTLERAAAALELFTNLIATNDGQSTLLDTDESRLAISLQLDGVSSAIRAVAEALASESRKPDPLSDALNSGDGSERP